MSEETRPMTFPYPPDEKGWYCVNLRSDPHDFPELVVCRPILVWWNPKSKWQEEGDEHFCYRGGGIQGIEQVTLWGKRVDGIPDLEEEQGG